VVKGLVATGLQVLLQVAVVFISGVLNPGRPMEAGCGSQT